MRRLTLAACLLLLCIPTSASATADAACDAASDVTCNAAAAAYNPYAPSAVAEGADAAAPPNVQHMWTTPLFITRAKLKDPVAFNSALSKRALNAFEGLLTRSQAAEGAAQIGSAGADVSSSDASLQLHRGDSAEGANEAFFIWQRDQHALGSRAEAAYLSFVRSSEFQSLQRMFASYTRAFLQSLGKADAWPPAGVSDKTGGASSMFCWASVSRDGNSHLSHTHPSTLLSGVYYSRIPSSGAGSLIFDDPRGPRWPFDGRFIHRPAPSDLILFPSWLVHQVSTTTSKGKDERISWSCNMHGSWDELADVNLV